MTSPRDPIAVRPAIAVRLVIVLVLSNDRQLDRLRHHLRSQPCVGANTP
jgi:hypothetical protein